MTSPSLRDRHAESRKRSRSPAPAPSRHHVKRPRSRSPGIPQLPFHRAPLHKFELKQYTPVFAEYLDVQKQLDIYDLTPEEVKGRWKSFLGKWNRGELAEGWYDPQTKRRADERYQGASSRIREEPIQADNRRDGNEERENDDDDYGPALPKSSSARSAGPAIPTFQDLRHRHELTQEDCEAQSEDVKAQRKRERNEQKARLEELAPRADPGSRERQLEKKRETTTAVRAAGEAKTSGVEEVGDGELMGGDDDGVEGYKAKVKAKERVKNEREIRREEILRARAAEREERMAGHRMKEEKTLDMLKSIAKQRFG